jgi:hypothetical protein
LVAATVADGHSAPSAAGFEDAMLFWSLYLFLVGFLVFSAFVVMKARMGGASKAIHVLIALMLIYGFYKFKYPTYTYRYRMTVAVDVAGETRSASSVIEISATRVPQILPEVLPYERSAWGQAVFIQLSSGKNIVALLTSGPVGERRDYPFEVIPLAFRTSKNKWIDYDEVPTLRGRRELTRDQMPTFVTVSDPNDGRTARVVNVDDLATTLGVHLRSISVEMTKDAVTPIDIERHLPFLVVAEAQQRREMGYPGVFTPYYSSFVRR